MSFDLLSPEIDLALGHLVIDHFLELRRAIYGSQQPNPEIGTSDTVKTQGSIPYESQSINVVCLPLKASSFSFVRTLQACAQVTFPVHCLSRMFHSTNRYL